MKRYLWWYRENKAILLDCGPRKSPDHVPKSREKREKRMIKNMKTCDTFENNNFNNFERFCHKS